ncbi:hypothetical protein ACIP6I_10685 [Streptomyces anulatus]
MRAGDRPGHPPSHHRPVGLTSPSGRTHFTVRWDSHHRPVGLTSPSGGAHFTST